MTMMELTALLKCLFTDKRKAWALTKNTGKENKTCESLCLVLSATLHNLASFPLPSEVSKDVKVGTEGFQLHWPTDWVRE